MKVRKIYLYIVFFCVHLLCGCDLQPKIASIPDAIGLFIESRYPALLADPQTQPEIYNSAVTDYDVYPSPDLYGSSNINDYILYSDIKDYTLIQQESEQQEDILVVPGYNKKTETPDNLEKLMIEVAKGDTVYSLSQKNNMTVSEFVKLNDLKEPYTLSVGKKLFVYKPLAIQKQDKIEKPEQQKTTRVELEEISVISGDTLYSLSRKYKIPVNDLAVMNKLSVPFNLSVGQKLKVPKFSVEKPEIKQTTIKKVVEKEQNVKKQSKTQPIIKVKTVNKPQKISSDPKKQLPAISARSNSKFSWPIRGKILSAYGPKNGGLVNDGINISATLGSDVKAAENGVVAYAGNEVKGMGNLIIIQHSGGWMTVYAHLDSMSVRRGTKVGVGQKIGKIGKTGKVDKPQLHFEIRKGKKSYNPVQYLKK